MTLLKIATIPEQIDVGSITLLEYRGQSDRKAAYSGGLGLGLPVRREGYS